MRRRGLTLLEIVVAISLIYLLVTFVFQLLPSNLYALMRGQSRMTAESLANSQLLSQAHRPFSSLTVGLVQTLPDISRDSKTYHSQLEVLPAGHRRPYPTSTGARDGHLGRPQLAAQGESRAMDSFVALGDDCSSPCAPSNNRTSGRNKRANWSPTRNSIDRRCSSV